MEAPITAQTEPIKPRLVRISFYCAECGVVLEIWTPIDNTWLAIENAEIEHKRIAPRCESKSVFPKKVLDNA